MVDFEQAKELALECWPEVDYFIEYKKAFSFSKHSDKSIGGNSPVVVDKKSGECLMFVSALGDGLLDGEVAREGKLVEGICVPQPIRSRPYFQQGKRGGLLNLKGSDGGMWHGKGQAHYFMGRKTFRTSSLSQLRIRRGEGCGAQWTRDGYRQRKLQAEKKRLFRP